MKLSEEPRPPRMNPYSLFLHKPIRDGWGQSSCPGWARRERESFQTHRGR